jgi:uncharacterized membrane protein (DUF4010 family)
MDQSSIGVVIALFCGAVVGVERQWSGHATGAGSHFAGVRTFTLLGGLSGAVGLLWGSGYAPLATVLIAGAVALVAIGYAAVARRDLDATTEVAALVVIAAGALAGIGMWGLASGIAIVTVILLMEKSRLHTLVSGLSDAGLRAGIRFALMAVVILPLLPEGPYGPLGGVRPRELWILVLFFSGLSFFAYVIRSIVGTGRGYVIAGLLGGLISSTNVTLNFSRTSAKERDAATSLALGVLAACTMMYLRVNITAAVLNREVGAALIPYMLVPGLLGAALFAWGLRRVSNGTIPNDGQDNPLQLSSAIRMAVLFQFVLYCVTAIRDTWGGSGLIISGAILGLTDVDALVISAAKTGTGNLNTATVSTVVGTISNTVLKMSLAAVLGKGRFRVLVVCGLAALAITSGVILVVLR